MKKEVDEIESNSISRQMELQRQTENLRKSESRHKGTRDKEIKSHFAEIFYSSKDAIGYADLKGVFLDVNNAFTKLTGYSKEELLYRRKYQDITPKEYQKFEDQMVEKILRTGEPIEYEKEFIRKDGSRVPVLLTAFMVQDNDGESEGIAAIIKDITERKRTEKALCESEEKYRTLVERSYDLIIETSIDGRFLYLSPKHRDVLGYSPTELIGRDIFENIHPDDRTAVIAEFKKAVATNSTGHVIFRYKHKNGSWIWLESTGELFQTANGEVRAIIASRDITERKRAEEALRESEERFRLMADNSPVMIWMSDINKGITYCNKTFLEFTGTTMEQHLGYNWSEVVHPDDLEFCLNTFMNANNDRRKYELEHRLKCYNGEYGWVLVHGAPRFLSDGTFAGFVGSAVDITERKRAEKALEESEKRYRDLFNNVPTGMYRITPDGRILMANPALIQMLGYPSFEELASLSLEEGELTDSYNWNKFKRIIEWKDEVRGLESSWKKRDGTVIFVRENARAIRGEDGTVQYYEGTVEDITERKILYERSQRQAEELVALYEDINRRNKDLEILNAITQAVHQSLDLEQVYSIALDMTVALENIDMAMIYLVDEDRKEAVLQAHRNIHEDYIRRAGSIPYPKGITWKVINSGEILNVEDAQRDPVIGPAGRDLGHHGILGIPIALEGITMGVIWFFNYKEHKFSRHEVDFLSSIGNQIAIAIAKAKLYRELSKKSKYETIISTVTRSVHKSINLQDVLENAVDTMSKNIEGMHHVAIYLVEGEEAVFKAYRGYPDWFIKRVGRIPYPKGFTWKTIIEGKPLYCADVDKDTVIGPAGREVGTKSYASMPLHFEGKTIGAININSLKKNAFDEEELKLLNAIAHQIEIAINNAQIAEALRQSKERYRILFDQSPVGVYIFDKSLKIINCNESLVWILRTSYDNLIGLDLRRLRSRRILSLIERVFEGQSSTYEGPYRVKGNKGRILASIRLSPLRCANGNVIGGMAVIEDITERKQAEQQLRSSREQLRSLAAHLESIREEERTRIALEIHDGLSQSLTGLKMGLSWLDKKLFESSNLSLHSLLEGEITNMANIIETTFQLVQEISTELRPKVLDDLGLISAIEWQTQEFQTRMGIRCIFTSNLNNVFLDRDQSTAIFRILQESLTNVARHANATRVDIKLKKSGGKLVLEVRDNGKGITEDAISDPKSFGLMGMRERALLLEGEVVVTGAPGKGTKIIVRIPFRDK